jgi:L-arabinose isomerase
MCQKSLSTKLKKFEARRPRVGVVFGAMEWYWTMTGMEALKEALVADAKRFSSLLADQGLEVIESGMVCSHEQSAATGKQFRDQKVDLVVFCHGTYVDDKMTFAFLGEYGNGPLVLAHTQGLDEIPEDFQLIDYARCWGNNSSVQILSSMKRMTPDRRIGYVFGHMPDVAEQIGSYARAAKAMQNVRQCRVGYLPHRCNDAPMYDIFPDDTQMMGQTGVAITYAYIHEIEDEMGKVTDNDAEALLKETLEKYPLIEPSMEEMRLAIRLAIALERVVAKHELDAVAIDAFPEMAYRLHQLPNIGMDRLMDQGVVVCCEGDLTTMVGGLYLRELSNQAPHFWEHLMFDVEKNWILGGHDGGSAAFSLAADPQEISLRNMMYIEYKNSPPAPRLGVVPEFILKPGRVTWLNIFRDPSGYVMRLATGESVDTPKRPVHHEHLIFKPDVPLDTYFRNMKQHGVDHHFMFTYGDHAEDLAHLAELLDMPCENLTN